MSEIINKSLENGEGASDTGVEKRVEDHSGPMIIEVSSEAKPIAIIKEQASEPVGDNMTASIREENETSSSSINGETVVHKCPLPIQGTEPIGTNTSENTSSKNTRVLQMSISSQLKSYVKSMTGEMKQALNMLDSNEKSAVEILRQASEAVEQLHKKVNLARKEFMLHAEEKIEGILDVTRKLEMELEQKRTENPKRSDIKTAEVKPVLTKKDSDVSHAFDEVKAALSEIENSLDQLETSSDSPNSSDSDFVETTQFNNSLHKTN